MELIKIGFSQERLIKLFHARKDSEIKLNVTKADIINAKYGFSKISKN